MSSSDPVSKPGAGPAATEIDFEEFAQAWADGACAIVDVREAHEYAVGHIPDAVNLPLSSFDPAQLPRDKPVVLVCQAGVRSLNALRLAAAAGVEGVRHYTGGTAGWRRNGGDLEI